MTIDRLVPTHLSDDDLLAEVTRLTGVERAATVRLIAALAEVDARRLYLGLGCSSLFVYCTRVLHLSEHAAYGRIEAARAARRLPVLLDMLERGELGLTSVCLLAPHVTEANHVDVLARARHRSKRDVEEIVASLRPQLDVPATVRKLPDRPAPLPIHRTTPGTASGAPSQVPPPAVAPSPAHRPIVEPLAPERYRLQLTIDRATQDKLCRARDLMRHSLPSGDLASILERALDLLLADLERTKLAAACRPRPGRERSPGSRHIPAALRRAVWARDSGRCAFAGALGRCDETAFLEFHHVRPFAAGGDETTENIELRCRAHNQYEADLFFARPPLVRERPPCFRADSVRTGPSSTRRWGEVGPATPGLALRRDISP